MLSGKDQIIGMASLRCDYKNHQGTPCQKSAKFRYEFSCGKTYHCCGNRHHCDMIVSKMNLEESINVFVYEQMSEQFVESHSLNCFNIVFTSKIFQGPYSEKETYLLQLKKQSIQYSKDLVKYMNTLETMKNLKEEATTLRLTLESPFLSISEQEYEEMSQRLIFVEMAMIHNINDVANMIESERMYTLAKEKYEDVLTFKIPWVIPEDTDECTICFENVNKNTGGQIDCGHSFHNDCLRPWIRKNGSCPNCRDETSFLHFVS